MTNALMCAIRSNVQAQRPPPETPGRLQHSLRNYPNRPTAQRGGGSLQRPTRRQTVHLKLSHLSHPSTLAM